MLSNPTGRQSISLSIILLAAVLTVSFLSQGCSPTPRRTLTTEEKIEDLDWIFAQFRQNYAPLDYKSERYGFNYNDLRKSYIDKAAQTKTNEEFYALMYSFVSEFRDAHTSASLVTSSLPDRTFVAYLGFGGKRKGKGLIVTELLPSKGKAKYPIHRGDFIKALDGVPLDEFILKNSVHFRNLGQDESNLTYHMNGIFNRISTGYGLPDKKDAILTVDRGFGEETIILPWIVQDLYDFTNEQSNAQAAFSSERFFGNDRGSTFDLALLSLDAFKKGSLNFIPPIVQALKRGVPGYNVRDSFVFIDTLPTWTSPTIRKTLLAAAKILGLQKRVEEESPLDELRMERSVPSNVLFIQEAYTYPTYIMPVTATDKNGQKANKQIAYMYLNTFSPETDEDLVLSEVSNTLSILQSHGIKDIIIDMINNGGGSLELGLKLAQLFSNKKILMPNIQYRLSESWVDEFEELSLSGDSATNRELSKRIFNSFLEDQKDNKRISKVWSSETLIPFDIQPNESLNENFKIVLLVNEMCASMCDIFTATLKDNEMATIVGSKTMGAGGNVVSHWEAPNSHLTLNQTESLILRKDGTYIENNGIEPDVAMPVNEYSTSKYSAVRSKAVEVLTNETTAL